MHNRGLIRVVTSLWCFHLASWLAAQEIGDGVRLESSHPQGVPIHPAAGDNSFVRWANGTTGIVAAIDPATGWLQINANGQAGWAIKRYLTVIQTDAPDEPGAETPSNEALVYHVGTWNLEWLSDGKTRGFPENTYSPDRGQTYGPRTLADYQYIAGIITNRIFARLLVLNEINGGSDNRSIEMDRLISCLGSHWEYELGASGGPQRIALLYDRNAMRKDRFFELAIPEERLQNKDTFERDPLVAKFTLLDRSGMPRNDLVVVGLHLASGQHLVQNHDKAMQVLRGRLHQAFDSEPSLQGEKDVLILGDLNASRYDNDRENFWGDYDNARFRFRTLSPDNGEEYPGTRLAGVPLFPRSKIDYVIASGLSGGMLTELVQVVAQVHTELLSSNFEEFRRQASDHLPVTVRLRVVSDDD